MTELKRSKRTVSTPGIAEDAIANRLEKLGLTFREYVNSLIAYDCWAEKPHTLTGDAVKDPTEEETIWKEIIADAGKGGKVGSFFEVRLSQIAAERLAKKGTTSGAK